ncbi:hypothetical protein [Acinetobacter sp. YH12147]|uniref:hypothetical protein n=1 Tax=Acinetobacter sp. YH12147 TaxID=2601130 RepID=UPI0015D1DCF0|nr:hypothetical protein [Acinetobacter sp. YH12147]
MIQALKYALASSILLISTTQTYANNECTIYYSTNATLEALIKEKKFVFDNYDKVCKLLRSANAAVDIVTAGQISPYQTSSAVQIRLQDLELSKQGLNLYSKHNIWLRYNSERTSAAQEKDIYGIAMVALNGIDQDLVDDLNLQRAALKRYIAKK